MSAPAFGDVKLWQSAPLGQAGDGLKSDITALERSRDQLESQAIPDSWQGLARFFATTRRDLLVGRMAGQIDDRRGLQRALYDAETQVAEIERLVGDVEGEAKAQEFTLGDDGSVTDAADSPTFHNRWEAEEWSRVRSSQAQALADDITALLGKAAAADATIISGIPSGVTDDIDEYGSASPDVAERWATLTDAERRAVIEQMIEDLADENGVEVPGIDWRDESWGSNGEFSGGEPGTVSLNEGLLDDPRLLHTVAHEMRHARQGEAIRDTDDFHFPWEDDPVDDHTEDGISEEQIEEWDDNFDDYKSTDKGDTYEEYFEQPVEADAREAGKDYLDGLTEEELDRLLEEAR